MSQNSICQVKDRVVVVVDVVLKEKKNPTFCLSTGASVLAGTPDQLFFPRVHAFASFWFHQGKQCNFVVIYFAMIMAADPAMLFGHTEREKCLLLFCSVSAKQPMQCSPEVLVMTPSLRLLLVVAQNATYQGKITEIYHLRWTTHILICHSSLLSDTLRP